MQEPGTPWYIDFFKDDYLKVYATAPGRSFTAARDLAETAFVERALSLKPGMELLDLCCGQGRHAVPLAGSGIRVTGLDLSPELLDLAANAASEAGVSLELVKADMREIPYQSRYDAVINMFTAFGYLESDQEDQRVLHSVAHALKPGGRLLMDMLNREWVVRNYVQNDWHEGEDGTLFLEHRELDLLTSRNHVTFTIIPPQGPSRRGGHIIRLYTLTEMGAMLRAAGMEIEATYGGFDSEPYTVASRRMIIVARRRGA
jgi:SAM-dependent methyltransferase